MGRILPGAVLIALVLVPIGVRAGDETPYPQLYYRDFANATGVLGVVRNLALQRRPDSVLIVFDASTFAPPPGMNEFNHAHNFAADIPAWLDAIESMKPPTGIPLFVASTLSGKPIGVGQSDWRDALGAALHLPWWERNDLQRFPSAPAWIGRLLGGAPGPQRMLVLVTGDTLPEKWADHSVGSRQIEKWRRKLLEPGEYWNEEAVAAAVAGKGATLDIVAPEARFGDFLPVTDIPETPWASRPVYPIPQETPDEATTAPPASGWKPPEPAYRFNALTPLFCDHYGSYTFFNTDCPSRYGYWPFARAAAATGGRYLFYPFAPVDFLDVCPYDPALLRALAPEYESRARFVSARGGDPALQALCRAAATVADETDWRDGFSWFGGSGRASGWLGFKSATPLVLERRYRERNKPFDWLELGVAPARAWIAYGKRLARLLPRYDKAIEILDEAESEIDAGRTARPHRRSMANLRLGRFWLEMSAFHIQALSLYLTELSKHAPKEVIEGRQEIVVTYIQTIRMSDCLAGYEGMSIPEDEDEALQEGRVAMAGRNNIWDKSQSNILYLGARHPKYRALRHPRQVTKKLDPRLMPRAFRMIDAGSEVMRNEARSPWGWMAYYTIAYTFVYYPVPARIDPGDRPGVNPPDAASTPRPKPRARGPGSGGGN